MTSGHSSARDRDLDQTRRTHRMSPPLLEQWSRLMTFNWLVAGYAHREWLGSWAPVLADHSEARPRLLRLASMTLLDRHDLNRHHLKIADGLEWLFLPTVGLMALARIIGVAMLGGWVRNGLEREQVAQQILVLGPEQRAVAMRRAATLKALPFSASGEGWPLMRRDGSAVAELGLACMSALLSDRENGCRERFLMRFAPDRLRQLSLSATQRNEALELIRQEMPALLTPQSTESVRVGSAGAVR